MGLFDIFRGGQKGEKKAGNAAKWADAAGNKRAQSYERSEAIEHLANMGTVDAAEALIKRFGFSCDPSITDQEEKEAACEGIINVGRDAIPIVREYVKRAESLAYPMRIMKNVMKDEEFVAELLSWLKPWDTEYSKFIDPKLQLLIALEDHESPAIRPAIERFLEDVSDDARYAATVALIRQKDAAAALPLAKAITREESMRLKNKMLDAFAQNGWTVPAEHLAGVQRAAPYGYSVNADGSVQKH